MSEELETVDEWCRCCAHLNNGCYGVKNYADHCMEWTLKSNNDD